MSARHIVPENALYAHFQNTFWHHMQNTFEKTMVTKMKREFDSSKYPLYDILYIKCILKKILLLLECVTNINIKHRLRSARTSTQSDQNLRHVHVLYKSDPPAKRHSWYLLVSNAL